MEIDLMKKCLFVFAVIFSLSFISCGDFWDSITSATTPLSCVLNEKVEHKTEYKSFTELNNPLVLSVPVYDLGYNNTGSLFVVWDYEKNEIFDWVYTPKTNNIWNYAACAVEPEPGKTVYISGGANYSNYVVMDPAATTLKDYRKTKQGPLNKYINVAPKKPKYLIPVAPARTKEDELNVAFYITAFDTADGSEKACVGFRQNNIQEGYVPDQNGIYVFVRSELDIPMPIPENFSLDDIKNKYFLCEYSPSSNSIISETELKIDESCVSPDNSDVMTVIRADDKCVLIMITYGIMNPETELLDLHRKLVVMKDRTNGIVQKSDVIDLDKFCAEHNLTECLNAFTVGGKYYLVFEKYIESENYETSYSNEIVQLDIDKLSVIDTEINMDIPYAAELWIRGSRIYFVWSNYDYGIDFNYYDFDNGTKGEIQTLDGNIFNQ